MDEERLRGAAQQVGGKVESAVGSATGDTSTQAGGYVDQATGSAHRAYGKVKDKLKNAMSSDAGDYAGSFLDQVEDYGDYLADQIDTRPVTAVLIAAGVGFLIAMLTKPSPKVVYRRR